MAEQERAPAPEPAPYEAPAITDLDVADVPLATAPGISRVSPGGGGIG